MAAACESRAHTSAQMVESDAGSSPGVGHTLHGDLRGATDNAGVPGSDDDGGSDWVSRTTDILRHTASEDV